jgi:hypothetical protein
LPRSPRRARSSVAWRWARAATSRGPATTEPELDRALRLKAERVVDDGRSLARTLEALTVREHAREAAEANAARAGAARDRRAATGAELRVARPERELREPVDAIRGEAGRPIAAELQELRTRAPQAPWS